MILKIERINHVFLKLFSLFFIFLFPLGINAQKNESFFLKIEEIGKLSTNNLKEGKFRGFDKMKPPKDTWLFSKLMIYKEYLDDDKESILYGSYIKPGKTKGVYAYNFFAYRKNGDKYNYFFVAIITIDTKKDFRIDKKYLFTEEISLKEWWKSSYGFYKSDNIKEIPNKFLYPFCPLPPF